jgi:integrase
MRQAVRWRLLLENPADGLTVPQQPRNEMRALTVDQARTLLKATERTEYGTLLAVALTTGMRPSEYLGLKWQDIDWARQTVGIVRSIRRLDGKWCFSGTKRSRSRRPIKLQSWIVTLLRELQTKASAHDLYPEAVTWSSQHSRDSQSMPIVSQSISDQYSNSRVYTNDSMIAPLGGQARIGSRSVAEGCF